MRGDAALRRLEYLALLNRTCRELRLHVGMEDRVLGTAGPAVGLTGA